MTVLTIRKLRIGIATAGGLSPILRGVDLTVAAGETCGLVGESGAGKTMVTRALLGVLPKRARQVSGELMFHGKDILTMAPRQHRALLGRDIALIPQDPMSALNPVKTIGQQFLEATRRHDRRSRQERRAAAIERLTQVSMPQPEATLERYPHQLSGGMRQRVLIAIAFSSQPSLIIADEPTTALDVTVQKRVLALIKKLQAQSQTAILFVSHDLGVVAKLCDTVYVMHSGRIVEHGRCRDIIETPSHDYTRALLRATPRFDRPQDTLLPISEAVDTALRREAQRETIPRGD